MKTNWKFIYLMVSFITIFLFITYLGAEFKNIHFNNDTYIFLQEYLDNPQKYLFVVSLMLCIFVPIVHIPFLFSEVKSRLKNNVFTYVWIRHFGFGGLFSLFILCSFGLVALLGQYSNLLAVWNIEIFFNLFSFVLSFIVVTTIVYLETGKNIFGVACASALNFSFLIVLTSLDYYILDQSMNEEMAMLIFTSYVWLINLVGLTYLYFTMDRKEIL